MVGRHGINESLLLTLSKHLEQGLVLTHLKLSYGSFNNASMEVLAKALAANSSLRTLDLCTFRAHDFWLGHSGVLSDGAAALGDALGRNGTLEMLYLGICYLIHKPDRCKQDWSSGSEGAVRGPFQEFCADRPISL